MLRNTSSPERKRLWLLKSHAADPPSFKYRGIAVKSGLMGIVRGFNEDKAGPSSTRADNLEEVRELEKRNKELGEQVEAASKTIQSLRAMNSKLHAFVVDKG